MPMISLKDILEDETGVLKEFADKRNINFYADRFFVATLFFKEHNVDLIDLVFNKLEK